ncbi:MDR family MFS transporter [Janibacter sp. Soil728]|uniref:MDR family MFS transporter n=1 Tax=Janibacter sp. Soil728 TaxID=1736393 RepID=UPI0009E9827D|nr:MDR family MFS transporter [Janibacter sp. Soil728]
MSTTAPAPYTMSKEHRRVFIGLMLGMLVASVSQTIVGPALPRIVAELGGMDHYSWVATAAMLVSAVTVPIVGKLSDLYGRRTFYIGGIIVFMVGTIFAGFAQSFWMLVIARGIQGLGMGTLMPLSQTIIGDIIPPRQRGKYQGFMGAVFGVTSVAGPLAGGVVTDHLGWRWLFFVTLPIGLIALTFIVKFLHIPHEPRKAVIDYKGIATLSTALVALLVAVSSGGTSWAWGSTTSLALFAIAIVSGVAFVLIQLRAVEPILPLRLFADRTIALSLIASFGVAIVMFGSIIYIPVYAQGVIGVNATNSGLILMPLMLGFIVCGILTGLLITRTGHYRPFMLAGIAIMGGGVFMLTRLTHEATAGQLTLSMVVLGIGLGMAMQQYTLIVQNVVSRKDMGVATASTQFFRNVGSTVGIAVYGTIMASGLGERVASHLPAGLPSDATSHVDAGAVLDPTVLSTLPPQVADAVRWGLAQQLSDAFMIGLPVLAVVFVATLFIPHTPLRESNEEHPVEDAGQHVLDAYASESPDDDPRSTEPAMATTPRS